jgi:hypothetical protein
MRGRGRSATPSFDMENLGQDCLHREVVFPRESESAWVSRHSVATQPGGLPFVSLTNINADQLLGSWACQMRAWNTGRERVSSCSRTQREQLQYAPEMSLKTSLFQVPVQVLMPPTTAVGVMSDVRLCRLICVDSACHKTSTSC